MLPPHRDRVPIAKERFAVSEPCLTEWDANGEAAWDEFRLTEGIPSGGKPEKTVDNGGKMAYDKNGEILSAGT